MKRVFVCSPLRGNVERNIEIAKELCRAAVVGEGVAPFAPHLLYTQFLSDSVEQERHFGMLAGQKFLEKCDEVWVFGSSDWVVDITTGKASYEGVSEGMCKEIVLAEKLNIPVVYMPDCWKWIAEREAR